MPKEKDSVTLQEIEGKDAYRRYLAILDLSKEHLGNTAIIMNKEFDLSDVEKVTYFMIAAAEYAHPNVTPDYWRHLVITKTYAKLTASQMGFNPYEFESLALLHDLGKLISPHRYFRANMIDSTLFRKISAREEVMKKLPSVAAILGIGVRPVESIKDMSESQLIFDAIDNAGKVRPDGKLLDFTDMLLQAKSQPKNYSKDGLMWPSEKAGINALINGKQEFAIELLEQEISHLKNQDGIDFDKLRRDVETEWKKDGTQKLLNDFLNAQESLDPEVDKKLGRNPIKKIVFDIGGVLLNVRDEELIDGLSKKFGVPENKIQEAFDELNSESMAGTMPEIEYYKRFSEIIGVRLGDTVDEIRPLFEMSEIYKANPNMQEMVNQIGKGGTELYIYSNIIPTLGPIVMRTINQLYPKFKKENIFFSYDIHANKIDVDSFKKIANLVGSSEKPDEVLFIDDLEKYTTNARISGLRTVTLKGEKDIQRLKEELIKAHLIYN